MTNGTFTPQATIANRAQLGNRLLQQAAVGQPNVSGLSPFANLLQGLQGGFERGSAQSAQRQNQALQAQAQQDIGAALARGDFSGASASALGSGVPTLAGPGITLAGQGAAAKRRESTPLSTVGKIQADVRAGRITPEQATTAMERKPLVTVQTGGQKKFSERLLTKAAERADKSQLAAEAATIDLADLDTLEASLSNPAVYTGERGEFFNRLKSAGQTILGLDFQGVADAEVASRISKRLSVALQKDLPVGKLTDADLRFLRSIPAGLNASPEANKRIIALARMNAQRKIDRARIWEDNINEDGTLNRKQVNKDLATYDREFRGRVSAEVREMRAISKQLKTRSPLAGIPINTWSLDQIQKANKRDFTTEQLKQMQARKRALIGGR